MSNGHCTKAFLYFLLALTFFSCERMCRELGKEDFSTEAEETIRKEIIKLQILQRLGLSEKPRLDQSHKLSKNLALDILKRTDNLPQSVGSGNDGNTTTAIVSEDESNVAKISEIISFADKGPYLNGHTLLQFSYAGNNAYSVGARVKKAHLFVKMEFVSSIGKHFGHILHPKGSNLYIFHISGNSSASSSKRNSLPSNSTIHLSSQDVKMELVVSKTIQSESLGWQKLDVTSVVQKWYNKNKKHRIRHGNHDQGKNHREIEKLTLLVDCSGCLPSTIHPITFSHESVITKKENEANGNMNFVDGGVNDKDESPFLVLETEVSPTSKRNRRRALECSPRLKHYCCKQRFYLNFEDLGWDDWIIHPKGYYANYCHGPCGNSGGSFRTPDTFLNYHTHVMEDYRRTTEGQQTLEKFTPCCSPTKFAPMSLIYFGPDGTIIKRDLHAMSVVECGCP